MYKNMLRRGKKVNEKEALNRQKQREQIRYYGNNERCNFLFDKKK